MIIILLIVIASIAVILVLAILTVLIVIPMLTTRDMTTIYKSPESEAKLMAIYDDKLEQWPTSITTACRRHVCFLVGI
jgi:hypothetical protein